MKNYLTIAPPVISFILIFLSAFAIYYFYPLYGDDWIYSCVFIEGPGGAEYSTHRISSIGDIITSQYNHYMNWGGRTVVHVIDQVLLAIPAFWRISLNSLAFAAFVALIYRYCNVNKPFNIYLTVLIIALLWIFTPYLSCVIFWTTGSANYLWGTLILLLFLYPYYKSVFFKPISANKYYYIFFPILGLIAGWTNEASVCATIAVIFMYCFYQIKNKNRIPKWAILGIFTFFIGALLMMFAPGNFVRAELIGAKNSIFYNLKATLYTIYSFKLYLFYLIYVLYLLYAYAKKTNRKIIYSSISFFTFGCISNISLLFSPMFPEHSAFFFSVITTIIAIGIIFNSLFNYSICIKRISVCVIGILFLLFCLKYYTIFSSLIKINEFANYRELLIDEEIKKGNLDIIVPASPYEKNMKNIWFKDFSDDHLKYPNPQYAKYRGINSIRIESNSNE
ncbi:DUF6056 family protein [Dysgonomonas sp. 511]|uniref:DUF3329 domain-containing protein n=1 Tax=Dysgonomonas sp. 511 TaxID=2302930 RepID=UPI0013D8B037|nr:DUF6056 family protein [Dysgonomonas sp. 511]NDV78415.1 hypothetical protein [Dysgonomonas sp. 511]